MKKGVISGMKYEKLYLNTFMMFDLYLEIHYILYLRIWSVF